MAADRDGSDDGGLLVRDNVLLRATAVSSEVLPALVPLAVAVGAAEGAGGNVVEEDGNLGAGVIESAELSAPLEGIIVVGDGGRGGLDGDGLLGGGPLGEDDLDLHEGGAAYGVGLDGGGDNSGGGALDLGGGGALGLGLGLNIRGLGRLVDVGGGGGLGGRDGGRPVVGGGGGSGSGGHGGDLGAGAGNGGSGDDARASGADGGAGLATDGGGRADSTLVGDTSASSRVHGSAGDVLGINQSGGE